MENYNRGSEWRRWYLHVHTPEINKNDGSVKTLSQIHFIRQ